MSRTLSIVATAIVAYFLSWSVAYVVLVGWDHNYFRDYDPVTGRYMQSDPIGLEGGINTYAYAGGNPLRYIDPLGLSFDSLSSGCMQQMDFCLETGLIMMDRAIARSGDECLQERWQQARPRIEEGIKDAAVATAVATAVVGAAAVTRAVVQRFAARGLTTAQAANLSRFIKKLPRNAREPSVRDLPSGGKAFQAEVPGNVPGSRAVYEKQVDASGRTIQYTKTTYDPAGDIIHVKDKITGGVFP